MNLKKLNTDFLKENTDLQNLLLLRSRVKRFFKEFFYRLVLVDEGICYGMENNLDPNDYPNYLIQLTCSRYVTKT